LDGGSWQRLWKPMKILVLNSGSSSLKFKLLEMPDERELARGIVERIGEAEGSAHLSHTGPDDPRDGQPVACPDHAQALQRVLALLGDHNENPLKSGEAIPVVGHRLVHGRDLFSGPTLIDDQVLDQIKAIQDLAPLHMPPALAVLRACRTHLPLARHIACFDTAFYRTMPPKSYRYAVPREWHTEHGVRRYGFHGLSHHYVTECAARMLGVSMSALKLISIHLGNGASITAFDQGRVLDTSMGFTPLEGLIMGTRAGYLDPAVLPYLQRRTGMDLDGMVAMLNHHSGLQALSGCGRDMRTILAAHHSGHPDAALAIEMYVHTLRKYIGAYCFALGGCHAVAFAGGIGENAVRIRELVLDGLAEMGLILDQASNADTTAGRSGLISDPKSRIKIMVIPTDEERLIARQAYALVGREAD